MGVSGIRLLEKKKQQGFTIVELLIVIVIIAILATLVIVTYNGITTRAENAKTIAAVEAWAKALYSYGLDNGAYPAYTYPCLGTYTSNRCANTIDYTVCIGAGGSNGNATFNSLMQPYFNGGAPPQPSTQKMNCGGKDFVGVWYGSNGISATISILLRGNVNPCPEIGGMTPWGTRAQQDDMTICYKNLPTL